MEEASHIKKFLAEKIKKFIRPNEGIKEEIQNELKKSCNIDAQKENIQLIQGIAYLKISASDKNMVFMKKNHILKTLKNTLGTRAPKDIR